LFISIAVGISLLLSVFPSMGASFQDGLGREVILESPPRRIIPLAPSLTEILYYLGLGDRVVGVTRFSYFPPEAAEKPKIGSYVNLNTEKIITLNPDLAIGTVDGNRQGVVELLEQAGIPVYIVNPRKVRDVIDTVFDIGALCGVKERAHQLSSHLNGRLQAVSEQTGHVKRPLVFLQINVKPIITVNRDTLHHDLIRLAGGKNLAADEPVAYPRISLEEVIRRKPQVILISSMERGGEFARVRKQWLRWSSLPAVKNGRVHLINSDLIDRASPRIVTGLEAMAKALHPNISWPGERPLEGDGDTGALMVKRHSGAE